MAEWVKLSLVLNVIGFLMLLSGMTDTTGQLYTNEDEAVEILLIIAFLLYSLACILLLIMLFGSLSKSFIANVTIIICTFVAGKYKQKFQPYWQPS